MKWCVASILTVSRQVENLTALVDEYALEKHSAKFHPNSIWNNGALGFFEEVSPTTRRITRRPWCVATCDQFLIQQSIFTGSKSKSPNNQQQWLLTQPPNVQTSTQLNDCYDTNITSLIHRLRRADITWQRADIVSNNGNWQGWYQCEHHSLELSLEFPHDMSQRRTSLIGSCS